ncbi:MAG TPA: hypothetical protein VNJ52_05180 [Patescibacteria group bacterium]|nr:hypothetical protein [Patescibacteria group bacterium]
MDDQTLESVRRVLDYLWQDEYKSWKEDGKPDSHIFHDLCALDDWLKRE